MHRRGLAFNPNAEVWRIPANSSHRVSSLFPVHELCTQTGFPVREGKGWREIIQLIMPLGSMVFFSLFFFPTGLAHVTGSRANTRHTVSSDSLLLTACYWSTGVEESKNGKCKLLASKEIRVANASCSASNLENEVEELVAANWWESSFSASAAPAGWVSDMLLPARTRTSCF